MNFENMPELRWQYGYFAALTVVLRHLPCCCYVGFRPQRLALGHRDDGETTTPSATR
jgi:hypothetical protein